MSLKLRIFLIIVLSPIAFIGIAQGGDGLLIGAPAFLVLAWLVAGLVTYFLDRKKT